MKSISNNSINDPSLNLAMEEHVLKNLPFEESYSLFCTNRPSTIAGKNQNIIEEVNQAYIDKHQIDVVKHIPGGGAAYHDTGNLNSSFITDDDGHSFHNFKEFAMPTVQVLQSMGVNTGMTGGDDIQVGQIRVSGNATAKVKNRIFSHSILIPNYDLNEVQEALKVNPAKIKSKDVKSVGERVASIEEFPGQPVDIEESRKITLKTISGGNEVGKYILTEEDWKNIKQLNDEKYRTWEWNYGSSPRYNIEREEKFEKSLTQIGLDVKKGRTERAKLSGDFLGERDATEPGHALVGCLYALEHIEEALQNYDFYHYFEDTGKHEIVGLTS